MDFPASTTHWIAVYGAVVATIGLLINARREWTDRPGLRVRAEVPRWRSLGGSEQTADWMVIAAVNNGRRDIHLQDFGVLRTDGKLYRLAQNVGTEWPEPHFLPKRLAPTEPLSFKAPLLEDPRDVVAIVVVDSLGRVYRARAREVLAVLRITLAAQRDNARLTLLQQLRPWLPLRLLQGSR